METAWSSGQCYGLVIGPLQLVIHVVQIRRAGEQKSHWDMTNKDNYHFKLMYVFCLSCPSATFARQRGGFVPHEWPAAKGLFRCRGFSPPGTLVT